MKHAGALIAATASLIAALPAHAQTLEDGPTLPSLTTPVSGSAAVDQAVGTVIDAVKVNRQARSPSVLVMTCAK